MKIISYATPEFDRFQKRLNESAAQNGFTPIICDRTRIQPSAFYDENKDILDRHRGAGYWLWKPYLILETLKKCEPNETVAYIDTHHYISKSDTIEFIMDHLDRGVLMIDGGHLNSKWTKRDCFVLMDCDSQEYWSHSQLEAGQLAFSNNEFSIAILNEWLAYCKNKNILTDDPNICGQPNFPEFVDHRHDQSILSNLAIKHNIKTVGLDVFCQYCNEGR